MKKLFILLLTLVLVQLACARTTPTPTKEPTAPATEAPTEAPTELPSQEPEITAKLEELGGTSCEENPDFTCVTITVPLNHFDSGNTKTIDVVFAVYPASGERYGMFIQAFPGGPGGEGISTGGFTWYSEDILEHYDIVYFDQRGLGLSNPLECPNAYEADFLNYLGEVDTFGEEGYDTPEEQEAAINDARVFVQDCVAEIGIEPADLAFFGTEQVAEDIDSFRETIGDEKIWMYGVSYGTAVAQTYAYAHPDRLGGLILDGTINMTLRGEESSLSQEKAFDKVLLATLNACNADEACAADMGEDAVQAYDDLAATIAENPLEYEFPLAPGETVSGTFTFSQFEYTTAYQMYSLSGRMLYLRALAAANDGDMIPMLRLMYHNTLIDPETYEYQPDATFSDTMFYDVLCTDNSFFAGTQEERIAQIIDAGQASNGTVPRLDGSVYTGLYCAFWPTAPTEVVERGPLTLEGVPTFVLNATLDPATPFEEGQFVYENLADGYHLYVEGGRHSIYGWGYECPDAYVSDFLVNGTLPQEREIVCEDWGTDVTRAYEPWSPQDISEYENVLDALYAVNGEIQLQTEYFYGSFEEDVAVACPFDGSFTFGPSEEGESFTFEECAYIQGFALTGSGGLNYETSIVTFDVHVTGEQEGDLVYTEDYANGTISVTGEYGGEQIDLSQ
jgi:pimeloyl-ACP methyl ester carboxylesterase